MGGAGLPPDAERPLRLSPLAIVMAPESSRDRGAYGGKTVPLPPRETTVSWFRVVAAPPSTEAGANAANADTRVRTHAAVWRAPSAAAP
jgi:hypothetical protein